MWQKQICKTKGRWYSKNEVVEKTVYNELIKKVNTVQILVILKKNLIMRQKLVKLKRKLLIMIKTKNYSN